MTDTTDLTAAERVAYDYLAICSCTSGKVYDEHPDNPNDVVLVKHLVYVDGKIDVRKLVEAINSAR